MASPRTFALVGSETLLGREVRDLAGEGGYPFDLRLVAAGAERAGTLTALGDEAAVLGGLSAESLEGAGGLILAAPAEAARKAVKLAPHGVPVIDLAFAAEEHPDARLRAPSAEPAGYRPPRATAQVIAHPAAIALAAFLRRVAAYHAIRRATAWICAPASERGAAGIEELHQQALSLFAFKPLVKDVFDAQLSFNMLARWGEEAAPPLEDVELRIERHLATLLSLEGEGAGAPMPSLKLVQAPVFHGYSFSLWVEFAHPPGMEALEEALAAPGIDWRGADLEPPNNVGQAGQDGIAVGAAGLDRNHRQACWFWMVADNLRLAAHNALEVARQCA